MTVTDWLNLLPNTILTNHQKNSIGSISSLILSLKVTLTKLLNELISLTVLLKYCPNLRCFNRVILCSFSIKTFRWFTGSTGPSRDITCSVMGPVLNSSTLSRKYFYPFFYNHVYIIKLTRTSQKNYIKMGKNILDYVMLL